MSNGACMVTDSIKVTVVPLPTATVCCDINIAQGEQASLTLVPSAAGYTYLWNPSSGLSCDSCPDPVASPSVTTWYYVNVKDSAGCYTIDSVLINVHIDCGEVFVPSAFSPNNDGENDILYVRGKCITTMYFIVFDRWGNKVFESKNMSDGWDGYYKGNPMNTGQYVYYLKANLLDGTTFEKKGDVTLVR